ncbi:UvrD-helicase domain-containing protein [Bacillus methanolicus]|uniref:DNA helicase II / ATP-dependent DNA helicase PcrA n=1 Tax=Bacillus methanolicus (strain MGA3 / ATCC 53907) TaxID=796606 RepID=I3DTG7_BACMM|nr:UvrD-helicase domain-containing protein [Bacillus methanolicus]AIE61734.1 DNA helicase II / ATP-dependent DNA helicase PcrA [Bacillus methanolicus MGA3]EIJ77538.1 DNA helicase II / ATP-dependent DNA helicase PcrA [Bacillus methanolicus MGA3]
MKENKLMIAAAGSGKTTYLINEALKQTNGNVLITTYTEANEQEIKRKIIKKNKSIPKNITVQTWFSFLLQHGVRPYQNYLFEDNINGMILVNQQSGLKYYYKGRPIYFKENDTRNHYFNEQLKIYSDKISKFVVRCNEKSNGAVIDRISRIYSHIFIDEVQDLAGYDLEILKLLFKSKSNILIVGDPRQVTYLTHHEAKYRQYREGKIKEFVQTECKNCNCIIDEETLNFSYRNNQQICDFSSKLYPNYKPCISKQDDDIKHKGVFLVREKDIDEYLRRYSPIQLRDSIRVNVHKDYPSINFGYSKGLTFDRVLIYPTKPMIKWLLDHNFNLQPQSRSKFYVALTRAKYSVGIVFNYDNNIDIEGTQRYCEL